MKLFYKNLVCSKKNYSGRNNKGVITVRHKEGGCKTLYRKINFDLSFVKLQDNYVLIRSEYDPNRSAFIGLVYNYANKKFDYILLPQGLSRGDHIYNSAESAFKIKPGYRANLEDFTLGSFVHNISLNTTSPKGVFCRSNGNFAKILQKKVKKHYVRLKLPSGEERLIHGKCKASFGVVSSLVKQTGIKNAGRSRRLGRRPTVRGVAMNPVDHPHGGGEGKTSGGRFSVSPWGKLAIGKPTRFKKDSMIIKTRRQV
jgi:large subunit ribosomal protein L2